MFRAIVVGTDGSPTAGDAVRRAASLAAAFGADLHVVNAYKPPAIVMATTAEPGRVPSSSGRPPPATTPGNSSTPWPTN